MYAFLTGIPKEQRETLVPRIFMVLDEQSKEDRRVTIIHKGKEWLLDNGEVADDLEPNITSLPERAVGRRHRVPFEETA